MKNLPNYLTVANLICGCIAIVYILSAEPVVTENSRWIVLRDSQVMMGSVFILLAAVFDMFDGLAARSLGIYSPIGKYLDSLADVVSFGVAPAMIAYRGLWESWMNLPDALDVSMIWLVPAFLIAASAAWRLATYDTLDSDTEHFIGLPVPTTGLLFASIPLLYALGNPPQWLDSMLNSRIFWYLIIFLFTYLMNSKIEFTKSKNKFVPIENRAALIAIISGAILIIVLFQFYSIPIFIFIYIFVHFVRWLIRP